MQAARTSIKRGRSPVVALAPAAVASRDPSVGDTDEAGTSKDEEALRVALPNFLSQDIASVYSSHLVFSATDPRLSTTGKVSAFTDPGSQAPDIWHAIGSCSR